MINGSESINKKSDSEDSAQLEILTFTLEEKDADGCQTLYGINVFKVKELATLPRLVKSPNSHRFVPGLANIRGLAVPVVDLQKYYGCTPTEQNILILTEFSGSAQGFIANEVKTILHLDWRDINQPPEAINDPDGGKQGNTFTGISILPDGEMVMIVDLERIIFEVLQNGRDVVAATKLAKNTANLKVFFADDSVVARAQIAKLLDKMGIDHQSANDGQEALDKLDLLAKQAESDGRPLSDYLNAIITDIEMPLMDGYVLTRHIKKDRRFDGIPVMMHSSLSADQSKRMGDEAGVDAYLTKLQPKEFSEALNQLMGIQINTAA